MCSEIDQKRKPFGATVVVCVVIVTVGFVTADSFNVVEVHETTGTVVVVESFTLNLAIRTS
jgi:hypothetical protein